jgi:acyl-coenzyme A thioesterase PaaI-like protein
MASIADRLLGTWDRTRRLPAGDRIFGLLLGRMVPYSSTIRPRVTALEPGRAVVEFRDRRGVRNHLRSIHAIALANAGELSSGLAMTTALPPEWRAIVTEIRVEYHKKARGDLVAEGTATLPSSIDGPTPCPVRARIRDRDGEVVAEVEVSWLLDLR